MEKDTIRNTSADGDAGLGIWLHAEVAAFAGLFSALGGFLWVAVEIGGYTPF